MSRRRRTSAAQAVAPPEVAAAAAPATGPRSWERALPWLVVGAVWLGNAVLTWGRWGDLVTDCGRELDAALQLAQGRLLYADVRYWYGPLAPYVNALLFRLFGASVDTLAAAGLLSGALLALLGYRTVRLFCGRVAATCLAVALLQVDVFVQLYPNNIFNFVVPYAVPATYGMVLALASVFFLLRHAQAGRPRDLWTSTALLGLVALSKIEPLFAAAVAHLAFLAGLAILDRRRLGRALVAYLPSLALAAGVYGGFHARVGTPLWRDNLFLVSNVTAGGYAARHSGLLDLGASLQALQWSLLGLAGCAACAWVAQRDASRLEDDLRGPGSLRRLVPTPAVGVAALVAGALVWWLGPLRMFRALPLLVAGALLLTLRRGWAAGAAPGELLASTVLWVFALGGLARIVLRAGAEHYGFYLLVPGLVAFAVLWCREVPGLFGGPGREAAGTVGAAMLLAAALAHGRQTQATAAMTYGERGPVMAGTRRGALPVPVPYVGTVDEAVRFLEEQPPGRRVLVVPQGAGLTFVAGLDNALGLHTLLPLDVGGTYSEPNLIRSLEQRPPDLVLITKTDTRDYGKEGFGIDYGLEVARWISARYVPVKTWRTAYYSVIVLGLRETPAR